MNAQEQIKALAELDGYQLPFYEMRKAKIGGANPGTAIWHLPKYLSSYDAIIPLIQKQSESMKISCYKHLKGLRFDGCPIGNAAILDIAFQTPSQLAEALLRTTGKWKE